MRSHTRTRPHLTVLITVVIGILTTQAGTAGAAAGFGDVESDRFYTEAVQWMVGEDITEGIETGCFGPDLDVSRGQVAAFLHRLDDSLGNNPRSGPHPFVDITASYQHEPVGWLFAAGLTTGVSATRFAPDASITRGDFAVMLWRYADEPDAVTPHPFRDVTRGYQQEAISWMSENLITTGTSATTFSPDAPVSRAEAATFLFRYVDPAEIPPAVATVDCTRELRLTLEVVGLTGAEARCAVPFLVDFEVAYLVAVAEDRATASLSLIIAAAAVGEVCLTPDRVADLSRLFL